MKFNGIIVVALIAALGLFTGCGSDETPKEGTDAGAETSDATNGTDATDTNTTETDTTDNNTDAGNSTDNNTDIGGTGGSNGGATDCTQAGSGDACYQCYAQQDAAGYQAYVGAIVQECLCSNECQADCAAECADPSTLAEGSACNTCFSATTSNQQSACLQGFSAACQADNTCLTFAMNVQNCPQ